MNSAVAEKLAREVLGNCGAFEYALREAIGNTNYVLIRDLAELVLKQADRSPPAHPETQS